MDRRITKTRAAIRKAYFDLIVARGDSKVSVSELARCADIDRKTFYLHYTSPDEVLDEYVEEQFGRLVQAMEERHFFDNPFDGKQLFMLLDKFYKEEEAMLLAIAGCDAWDSLWDRVHDILADRVVELYMPLVKRSKEEIRICYDYFGRGIVDVYRRWVKGEYTADLMQVIETISSVTQNGMLHFTSK